MESKRVCLLAHSDALWKLISHVNVSSFSFCKDGIDSVCPLQSVIVKRDGG